MRNTRWSLLSIKIVIIRRKIGNWEREYVVKWIEEKQQTDKRDLHVWLL